MKQLPRTVTLSSFAVGGGSTASLPLLVLALALVLALFLAIAVALALALAVILSEAKNPDAAPITATARTFLPSL